MKLLNVLMLFIFIQFILTTDDKDDSSSDENNCEMKFEEKGISYEICENKKVQEGKICCLLSIVEGAKRKNSCLPIEDDEIEKQRYLNKIESNKISGSILADDASIYCFSNINKYKNKIYLILLFVLLNV